MVPTFRSRRYTHLEVGRNKPVRALSAGQAFPAADAQECLKRPPLLSPGGLIPAYIRVRHFSLHAKITLLNRLVYKDDCSALER
jgi:hypothetical protein